MQRLILAIGFLLPALLLSAQQKDPLGNAPAIERNPIDNTASSIVLPPSAGYGKGQVTELFRRYLGIENEHTKLILKTTTTPKQGTTVERYEQYYKGIKVEYATYAIMYDREQKARFMQGNFYAIDYNPTSNAVLSESEARDKALLAVSAEKYAWQDETMERQLRETKKNNAATHFPKGNLVWIEDRTLAETDRKLHLAYSFDIFAVTPLSHEMIYIDAVTGKVLERNSLIKHTLGSGNSLYSGPVNFETSIVGGSFALHDTTRSDGVYTLTYGNTGGPSAFDVTSSTTTFATDVALDAHWGAEQVYDYWLNEQERNSFDDAGGAIISVVHYLTGYDNAFWDGMKMVYGDGGGPSGYSPLAALDVTAHEIGHAICLYTSNLTYSRESGAIDEGLSDIWAAVIEDYANPHETDAKAKSTWRIGEEITTTELRRMDNPNTHYQPDTYGGTYWIGVSGCTPTTGNDNCWVHINSGIMNHWFYLLSQGGAGTNDIGHTFAVSGIGMATAAKIVYETELVLASNATYASCRTASINAATILYGPCSDEVEAVTRAWYAVGVGADYVAPVVPMITGSNEVCQLLSVTFSHDTTGGTWSSSIPSIASVTTPGGVVTGVAAGTASISYTLPDGCVVSKYVTVNAAPGAISGPSSVCIGHTISLGSTPGGGTWSSSLSAAVGSTGIVTGVSAGIALITYTLPSAGCFRTKSIAVNPDPASISGITAACKLAGSTLSCLPSGGTWASSDAGVAYIDYATGSVLGMSDGVAYITYTLGTGCFAVTSYTVHPIPAAISGPATLCIGGVVTMSSVSPGGSWSSSSPGIAAVDVSGNVTGLLAGTAIISYSFPSTGCKVTKPVTILSLPVPIIGGSEVCVGSAISLSHPAPGGSWASSDITHVTVGPLSGMATGVAAGTATISYTLPPAGCYVVKEVTANPLPDAITGGDKVCVGNDINLSCSSPGGSWTVSSPSFATIGVSGTLTGLSTGTVTVSYILGATGCYATKTVTVAPTVTPTTGNNAVCYGDTMQLSNSTPGGTWSSLTPSIALIGASDGIVLPVPPGTPAYSSPAIVIVQYLAEPGCYTTYQFSVFRNDGQCSPCNSAQFGTSDFSLLPGGIVSATSLSGNHYLTGDMTVQNDLVLQDAVLFIKPGVKITVDPAYSLTSNGSHLFSCGTGMWKGIELKTGPTGSGVRTARAILQGSTGNDYGVSTLIEDAETALSVFNPVKPNTGGNYFIESRNTIFNHNNNGIYVDNYTPSVSSLLATPQMYEFLIKNTTFTCRNIGATTPGFPVFWPSNYGPGGMKAYTTPATPYEPSKYVTNYTYSLCHNGLPAYTGVKLNKVGVTTGGTYTGIQIGAPSSWGFDPLTGYAPEQNMFDALGHGIWAVNTNLKVRNGIFEKMKTTIVSGPWPLGSFIEQTGVYTEMNDTKKYELDIQPVTSGYGIDAQTATNSFYDCAYGVYSKNYNRITCNGTYMWSTQVFGSGSGKQGIVLQSPSYEQVQANDNSIYNLKNGISFVSSYTGGVMVPVGPDLWMWSLAVSHIGNLEINNNRIQAAVGTTTPTTQYVSFAIAVQNSLPTPTGFASTATGEVHTDGNTIKDAFRGILVNGYQLQPAKSKNNTVTVRPSPSVPQKCWGINHSNNLNGIVSLNTVNGVWSGNNSPLDTNVSAYLCELNRSETVNCNYADNTGQGYEFYHDNPATWWLKNEMVKHMKGYMLNYSAIGPQGWSGFNFENTWSNSSWWGIGSSKYQTFVEGSPAAGASQLYVSPSVFQEPTENWGNPTPGAYSSSSIHAATGYQLINCQSDDPISSGGPTARAGAYEPHVKDLVTYDAHADARKWIAQYAAWEAVNIDTVLTDSSAVLAQFKSMAAGSRMAYLSDIEVALATGDLATAGTLIATPPSPLSPALCIDTTTGVNIKDDSTVDYIIDKNRELYDIYLRYMQYTMDSVDTASIPVIAQLCPLRYGSVVYKARALYTAVYNDLQVWCENCEDMESAEQQQGGQKPGIKPAVTGDGMQAYALFPNPNDGNLVLVQKVADTGLVAVDVADVLGRSVYKQQVRFTEKNHHLNLQNIAPGMYVTTVTDANGRKYTFKFVKQ